MAMMRSVLLWATVAAIVSAAPTAIAGECHSSQPEAFPRFFEQFAADKPFSVSRPVYPGYVVRHDVEAEMENPGAHTVRIPVSREDDAATPTIAEQVRKNGMRTRIRELSSTQAVIELFKPDTDWLLSYHFESRRGCWYLHHVEDHSL